MTSTDIAEIQQHNVIAIDTETTGLKYKVDKPFGGISLSTKSKDYYWDLRESPDITKKLQAIVDNKFIDTIVFHNAPFDFSYA